jgi:hypothetical protein
MDQELGMKELYEVTLKTTFPIEVNGRRIEAGETVARFDKISLGNFSENKNFFHVPKNKPIHGKPVDKHSNL